MTAGTYYTRVVWVPPSPLGLLGARWLVTHTCTRCRQDVTAPDLVDHTLDHAGHDDVVGDK